MTEEQVRDWIRRFADAVAEHRVELVRLDTAIGDGDHGTNMDRGMRKAVERLDGTGGGDIGADLKAVGMALVSSVGGAAGPLYGTLFLQMGTAAAGRAELDAAGWTAALEAGVKGVQARGKAEPGDKTMVDALVPALDALRAAGDDAGADGLDARARPREERARVGAHVEHQHEQRREQPYLAPVQVAKGHFLSIASALTTPCAPEATTRARTASTLARARARNGRG